MPVGKKIESVHEDNKAKAPEPQTSGAFFSVGGGANRG